MRERECEDVNDTDSEFDSCCVGEYEREGTGDGDVVCDGCCVGELDFVGTRESVIVPVGRSADMLVEYEIVGVVVGGGVIVGECVRVGGGVTVVDLVSVSSIETVLDMVATVRVSESVMLLESVPEATSLVRLFEMDGFDGEDDFVMDAATVTDLDQDAVRVGTDLVLDRI